MNFRSPLPSRLFRPVAMSLPGRAIVSYERAAVDSGVRCVVRDY